MILSNWSFDSFVNFSRCWAKLSAYQDARSFEFLMESGMGIGVKSNAPDSTAPKKRISVEAMCHARSSAGRARGSGR